MIPPALLVCRTRTLTALCPAACPIQPAALHRRQPAATSRHLLSSQARAPLVLSCLARHHEALASAPCRVVEPTNGSGMSSCRASRELDFELRLVNVPQSADVGDVPCLPVVTIDWCYLQVWCCWIKPLGLRIPQHLRSRRRRRTQCLTPASHIRLRTPSRLQSRLQSRTSFTHRRT